MREIIFDTETTGLKADEGDRIIEIGAVEMIDRRLTGRTLHHLIHPADRAIHPDAERIHGISLDSLAGKPRFEALADEIADFFGDAPLVAHNASFDIGFLDAELARMGTPAIDPDRIIDTLPMARRRFPGSPANLDALCRRFDISLSRRTYHSALLDAELLAEVYVELTGGRQAGLAFEAEPAAKSSRPFTGAATAAPRAVKARPRPLLPRLDDAQRDAHRAFVATLGDKALWHRYGVGAPSGDGAPKGEGKG